GRAVPRTDRRQSTAPQNRACSPLGTHQVCLPHLREFFEDKTCSPELSNMTLSLLDATAHEGGDLLDDIIVRPRHRKFSQDVPADAEDLGAVARRSQSAQSGRACEVGIREEAEVVLRRFELKDESVLANELSSEAIVGNDRSPVQLRWGESP